MGRFRQFMYGRYGSDQLSFFILILSVAITLGSRFVLANKTVMIILSVASWLLLAVGLFRMFSKNIYARQRENRAFLKVWYPVKNFFSGLFKKRADAATHKHFRCPACRQEVRVPRGKGKVRISCPRCGEKFTRST